MIRGRVCYTASDAHVPARRRTGRGADIDLEDCPVLVRRANRANRANRAVLRVLFSVALSACGAVAPTEAIARNGAVYSIAVGEEISLRLQSIGPGEYQSPPLLSNGALRFVDATVVGPSVPAGVTQRFRFRGSAPGKTVITFQHSNSGARLADTVVVY